MKNLGNYLKRAIGMRRVSSMSRVVSGWKVSLPVALFALLVSSSSVVAFDSSRKGFVIGAGFGHAVNSHWGNSDTPLDENKGGVGFSFLVGYAWDSKNMLVIETNATGYVSDVEWGEVRFSGFTEQNIIQGFAGVSWYHYYTVSGVSEFFTSSGVGIYSFNVQAVDANKPGFGALVGLGYAYRRHFQIGVYFGAGRTSSDKTGFRHSHINILASAVAF
jgi:hypothetical protein